MNHLDAYYINQKEPAAGCLMAMRHLILDFDKENITEKWYYRTPCFFYKGKMFAYLWLEKKSNQPYYAFYPAAKLTHWALDGHKRTSSKVLRIKTEEDLPLTTIQEVIAESLTHFKI